MKLIKLTDQDARTAECTLWEVGKTNSIDEALRRPELCSSGVFHAYTGINLAFLLNPIHSAIVNPRVFSVEGEVVVNDGLKVGCYELACVAELSPPGWYLNQDSHRNVSLEFSKLCAERVVQRSITTPFYVNAARAAIAATHADATIDLNAIAEKAVSNAYL